MASALLEKLMKMDAARKSPSRHTVMTGVREGMLPTVCISGRDVVVISRCEDKPMKRRKSQVIAGIPPGLTCCGLDKVTAGACGTGRASNHEGRRRGCRCEDRQGALRPPRTPAGDIEAAPF